MKTLWIYLPVFLSAFLFLPPLQAMTCNSDLVKEIGVDRAMFTSKSPSNNYSDCDRAKAAAESEALLSCQGYGLNFKEQPYSNCRVVSSSCAYRQYAVYAGYDFGYSGAARVEGDRMVPNLTAEQYKIRLCQRLNECLVDQISPKQKDQELIKKQILGVGCMNGCFDKSFCSKF